MTSRERVLTATRGDIPDRVPRDVSWGMTPLALQTFHEKTGGTVTPDEYFNSDVRYVSFRNPGQSLDLYAPYFPESLNMQGFTINSWGVGEQLSVDSIYHFSSVKSPLKDAETLNEIIDYPLPDYRNLECHRALESEIDRIHEAGLAVAGQPDLTLFETAWAIRGYESFMEDLIIRPDFAECLLDRLLAIRLFQVKRLAEAGVDVLTCGDDVSCQRGMMMNPDMFRRFFKPRYDQMFRRAKEVKKDILIFFHSDGDPGEIIPDLIELNLDILNPCQPECNDFDTLKRKYGKKLSFWGAVGIQELLPFGTREDIRKEIKRIMGNLGAQGGLLLGPTHVIEPEVPWENLVALYEAIDEFGSYS